MYNEVDIVLGLKNSGERLTKARKAIIHILSEQHIPLSAEQILQAMRVMGGQADKTTVYRELIFLQHKGIVREVALADRIKRYECNRGNNCYLRCTQCAHLVPVYLSTIAQEINFFQESLTQETKFSNITHLLEFTGVCRDCQKNLR